MIHGTLREGRVFGLDGSLDVASMARLLGVYRRCRIQRKGTGSSSDLHRTIPAALSLRWVCMCRLGYGVYEALSTDVGTSLSLTLNYIKDRPGKVVCCFFVNR